MPTWRDAIASYEWGTLPNSSLSASGVAQSGALGAAGIVAAWGGMVVVEEGLYVGGTFISGVFLVIAANGGHQDYGGNEVYAYGPLQADSPQWYRTRDRTEPFPNNVNFDGSGNPVSRHGYSSQCYVNLGTRNWVFSAGALGRYTDAGGVAPAHWYDCDIASPNVAQPWASGASYSVGSYVAAYEESSGRVWAGGISESLIQYYDVALNTATFEQFKNANRGASDSAAVDQVNGIFAIRGSTSLQFFRTNDIIANDYYTPTTAGTAPSGAQGFVYNKAAHKYVAWFSGKRLDALWPPGTSPYQGGNAYSWTTYTPAAGSTPSAPAANGTFNRFSYVHTAAVRGYVLLNADTESVYFYKLPSDAQAVLPDADITDAAWAPSAGADLFAVINSDNADFASTTTDAEMVVSLQAPVTPAAGAKFLRYRISGSPAKQVTVRLFEGASVVQTWMHDPAPSVPQFFEQLITGAISSYSDLRFGAATSNATAPPAAPVTWGAIGTGGSGTTSCTPAYPTGISAATSWLYCVVTGRSNTANTAPTMPAGWTLVGSIEGGAGTFGVDTGSRRVDYFKKDVTVGDETGTVTVSLAGTTANTLRASIFRVEVPSGYGTSNSFSAAADATNDTAYTTTSLMLDLAPNDLLLLGVGQNLDTGTATSPAITAAGITFGTLTNRASVAVTNGNDHRHILYSVPVNSGSASVAATFSYTASAACSGATGFLRLRATPPSEFARTWYAAMEVPASAGGGGGVTLTLGGVAEPERAGALQVAAGAVTLNLGGSAERETGGGVQVSAGAVSVQFGGVVERERAGSAVVAPGALALQAGGLSEREAGGVAGVLPGAASVHAGGLAEREASGTAAVSTGVVVQLGGTAAAERIGGAAFVPGAAQLQIGGLAEREASGLFVISSGAVLQLGGLAEQERAGSAQIAAAPVALQLGGLAEPEASGTAAVSTGLVVQLGGLIEREHAGGAAVLAGAATLAIGGIREAERSGGAQAVPGVIGIALGGVGERERTGGFALIEGELPVPGVFGDPQFTQTLVDIDQRIGVAPGRAPSPRIGIAPPRDLHTRIGGPVR